MPVAPGVEPKAPVDHRHCLPVPPPGGFTADDLDRIPDLPPHTELIDGSLVPANHQKLFHTSMLSFLDRTLYTQAPDHLDVYREMTIKLGKRQRPEPELLLARRQAITDLDQTWLSPEAVELVVEVVSPESEPRDRERKPQLYARAGISHFWLVEKDEQQQPVVFVHELAPSGEYATPQAFRDRLKVSAPFTIDIDLTQLF